MKSKRFLLKVSGIFFLFATLFVLVGCSGKEQAREPGFPSTEFVSSTNLFKLHVPTGWRTQEVIPGANLVMANSDSALARYRDGSNLDSGEIVLNIGFLPQALFQEKELSHLGIQIEASPEVFLQSLIPMFLVGGKPAKNAVGEATLVSLGDERDAGRLTFSDKEREGLILVFTAGKNVFAFISATTNPGGLQEVQEIIYAVAAGVAYNGSQDALYSKLYGD